MSRALILSCSGLKKPSELPLPAVERYDGPAFRVLRRFLRQSQTPPPAIRILSAEFGLIAPEDRICPYDRRMTEGRAEELQPAITAAFEPFCQLNQIDDLMVIASELYVKALAGCFIGLNDNVAVYVASGSIGRQISELRDWLYGEPPVVDQMNLTGHVTFKGQTLDMTASQVLDLARRELSGDEAKASKFETWCVHVDERSVAPKWLVSKLTGLPVAQFRTGDALNVLRKLGVVVNRVSTRTHAHAVEKEPRRCW